VYWYVNKALLSSGVVRSEKGR